MTALSLGQRIDIGMRAADAPMMRQDKIWSRYSNDKVDVGHGLMDAVRNVMTGVPVERPVAALSLGSSTEPHFRTLESIFRAGLWLVDVEQAALDHVRERMQRQDIQHVHPVQGDFRALLGSDAAARRFVSARLGGQRVELVTLHHSLYYAPRSEWLALFAAIYDRVLTAADEKRGAGGAIHAVLGASHSPDPTSVAWLYNYFAGRFFGVHNDQDLVEFAGQLRSDKRFAGARVSTRSSQVRFWADDFEQLMHVVWMVLLHPNVHRFNTAQQREVIEYVYENLFLPRLPLTQVQDHLFLYKGSMQSSAASNP